MDNDQLWHAYTEGKQTYKQLSTLYGCAIKTIQRRLDRVKVEKPSLEKGEVVALMDTTYFGRTFGVMLFKDAYIGKNLYKQYVKNETNALYQAGILFLKESGFDVKAIVCDGRKGLLTLFPDIPIQMCNFHQVAIITRYLTRKPKLQAAKELREHTLLLSKTDKESFVGGLANWHKKWESFL